MYFFREKICVNVRNSREEYSAVPEKSVGNVGDQTGDGATRNRRKALLDFPWRDYQRSKNHDLPVPVFFSWIAWIAYRANSPGLLRGPHHQEIYWESMVKQLVTAFVYCGSMINTVDP